MNEDDKKASNMNIIFKVLMLRVIIKLLIDYFTNLQQRRFFFSLNDNVWKVLIRLEGEILDLGWVYFKCREH